MHSNLIGAATLCEDGYEMQGGYTSDVLRLDSESTEQFRAAVQAATHNQPACDTIDVIYQCLQDAIDLRRPICITSGRCCRFEEFGHRLFVTTLELAAFLRQLKFPLDPSWNGKGCPFQAGGLCGVHPIRPFGCRIFFCDAGSTEWQARQYERFHEQIKQQHEFHRVPYYYVEWREALRAVELISPV